VRSLIRLVHACQSAESRLKATLSLINILKRYLEIKMRFMITLREG
jgi:hypothetical protein